MAERLFPLDSAGAGRVIQSSYSESPEEAAAMGDLAFCQQVPLSGSCKYVQPSPKVPEARTGLRQSEVVLAAISDL